MSLHKRWLPIIDQFMDSRIFTDRLRGGIAAFFLIEGLSKGHRAVSLMFLLNNGNLKGIPFPAYSTEVSALTSVLGLFFAAWIFFGKKHSALLALTYSILMFVFCSLPAIAVLVQRTMAVVHHKLLSDMSSSSFVNSVSQSVGHALVVVSLLWLRRLENKHTVGQQRQGG